MSVVPTELLPSEEKEKSLDVESGMSEEEDDLRIEEITTRLTALETNTHQNIVNLNKDISTKVNITTLDTIVGTLKLEYQSFQQDHVNRILALEGQEEANRSQLAQYKEELMAEGRKWEETLSGTKQQYEYLLQLKDNSDVNAMTQLSNQIKSCKERLDDHDNRFSTQDDSIQKVKDDTIANSNQIYTEVTTILKNMGAALHTAMLETVREVERGMLEKIFSLEVQMKEG